MAGPYLALPVPQPIADPRSGHITPAWTIFFQHVVLGVGDSFRPPAGGGGGGDPIPPVPPWFTAGVMAAGYWSVISNGDPVTPEILFDSNGDAIMGFVPTP